MVKDVLSLGAMCVSKTHRREKPHTDHCTPLRFGYVHCFLYTYTFRLDMTVHVYECHKHETYHKSDNICSDMRIHFHVVFDD